MRQTGWTRIAGSLWLAGIVAMGAAEAQSSPETISVIGRKPEDVRREAQEFVRRTGVADRPVARWVDPVCPTVLGVAANVSAIVSAKIEKAALDAGAQVARKPCQTNIVVQFTGNAGELVRTVAAKAPGRLKELPAEARAALLDSAAPIRWWYATEARTRDGMASIGNDVPPSVSASAPGGVPLAGGVHLQYRSSLASTQMIRALKAATIVVDVNHAQGTPLASVAAFAALIGLAEIRPDDAAPSGSVLGLFGPGSERELTSLDKRFLRALYRVPLDRSATAQRGLLLRDLMNGDGNGGD